MTIAHRHCNKFRLFVHVHMKPLFYLNINRLNRIRFLRHRGVQALNMIFLQRKKYIRIETNLKKWKKIYENINLIYLNNLICFVTIHQIRGTVWLCMVHHLIRSRDYISIAIFGHKNKYFSHSVS